MNQYQIDYGLNGISNVFELYLFVNPLGKSCYQSERELLKVVDLIASEIDLHIIPVHNQRLVDAYMIRNQFNKSNLALRNEVFQAIYQASLSYKAASIQGKRVGRLYLKRLQEQFKGDILSFNNQLAIEIAKEIGLDIETFVHDYKSDFVRQLFFKDQSIAVELGVDTSPSLVIFENLNGDGRKITSRPITMEQIFDEINHMMAECIEAQNQSIKNVISLK